MNPVSLEAHPHVAFVTDVTHFVTRHRDLNRPMNKVQRIPREVGKHSSQQPLYTHQICFIERTSYTKFSVYIQHH